jgi:hypothetical protein
MGGIGGQATTVWSTHSRIAPGWTLLALIVRELVVEDLSQDFILNDVKLLESGLQGNLIVAGGAVEIFPQAAGCVVHKHLGVLEALGVAGETEVNQLGVVFYLLQCRAGLFYLAVQHLPACDFGHGVDKLGVKEALVARFCLLGLSFEATERLSIREVVVDRGGEYRCAEAEEEGKGK